MSVSFVRAVTLAAGVAFVAAVPVARANLLVNPSFEQPFLSTGNVASFTVGQTIGAGWTVLSANSSLGSAVISTPFGNISAIWPNASDGRQILYVHDGSNALTFGQDVALSALTTYRLTFDLAGFTSIYPGNLGARAVVDVRRDGVSVLPSAVTFDRPRISGFATESLAFTSAAAGTYQLTLASPQNYGTNVDNFNLTAVPEPATTGVLAGMSLITLRRRR